MKLAKEKLRPFGGRGTELKEKLHLHLTTNWFLSRIKAWIVLSLAGKLYEGKRGAGIQLATLVWWCWRGRLTEI